VDCRERNDPRAQDIAAAGEGLAAAIELNADLVEEDVQHAVRDLRTKTMNDDHAVRFSVDYPNRALNRLATAFRVFAVIPVAIVVASIGGYKSGDVGTGSKPPSSR